MSERTWDKGLVLTAIAVAIISAVSIWLALHETTDLLQKLSVVALAPVLIAAVVSYGLRAVRFHFFLTHSGVSIPFRGTAIVQAVGFALSVTPGHIGEVFKLHLIRERAGTPVVRTAPLLLLDRVTEGGGFMLLAVGSALALPALPARIPAPVLILIGLGAMVLFALVKNRLSKRELTAPAFLSRRAWWQKSLPHLSNLWQGLQSSFTPGQIAGGLALSAIARCADGFVVLFAAHMLGVELALPAAIFVLALSGLAGGISLLPGGTGAVETSMAGLLALSGASLPNALTITLLSRMATLWLWVALGLGLAFLLRLRTTGQPAVSKLSED